METTIIEKMIDRLNKTFTNFEKSKLKRGFEISYLGRFEDCWGDEDFVKEYENDDDYLFFYDMFLYGLEEEEKHFYNENVWKDYFYSVKKKLLWSITEKELKIESD